jgi:hypothetical protein
MLTVLRAQLDLFDQLEIGGTHLLQLNGDGAPGHLGFSDAIVEHFTRKGVSPGSNNADIDYSNRRIAFDAAYTMKFLLGARLYYEIAFEDWRKHFLDAWVYDGDHLAGVHFVRLGKSGKHGLTIEYQHTGIRSQTHSTWSTGMTNYGVTLGTPLGPDAWSIYVAPRIDLPLRTWLMPWFELVRRSNDTYTTIEYGPIYRDTYGNEETRVRLGAQAQMLLRPNLRVNARALYEHVETFQFVPGVSRDNGGMELMLTWQP